MKATYDTEKRKPSWDESYPLFSGDVKSMKLYLLFAVIDIMILLAYPIVYVIHRIRKMMGVK